MFENIGINLCSLTRQKEGQVLFKLLESLRNQGLGISFNLFKNVSVKDHGDSSSRNSSMLMHGSRKTFGSGILAEKKYLDIKEFSLLLSTDS